MEKTQATDTLVELNAMANTPAAVTFPVGSGVSSMNVPDRAFWKSLARDLHDGVTQEVWYLQAELSYISEKLPEENVELKEDLEKLLNVAKSAYQELRSTLSLLQAKSAQYTDLSTELSDVASKFSEAVGMRVEFSSKVTAQQAVVLGEVGREVKRLVQKALWNSRQHSMSESARVTLRMSKNGLAVTVADDGCGFSPENVDQNHYGLRNMRERAEAIKGKLYMASEEGKGTVVTLHFPVTSQMRQAKENN